MSNMVSLHIPSFAPDGIFLCIISFPPSSPCGRFFCLKRKRKRKKENPCCASSSLLYGKNNGKSFPLFFLKQERKRQVQDHHSFLIFPFGRRTYKRGISFLSPLAEVIMHHLSLLFLSWRRKRKKEENASIHMQESFADFVRAQEEKRKSSTLSFPSSGEQSKRKRKANVTFSSSFFPCRRRNGESPLPWKRKEKKKKTRRRKNADRREKDKNEKERKEGKRMGETATEHIAERRIPDAGEQKRSRKRIFRQNARNGGRERCFSPHDGNVGRTAHLPAFSLPICISKHGKSGEPYFALFLPFSVIARTPPSLPFPLLLSLYLSFRLRFTLMLLYGIIVLS